MDLFVCRRFETSSALTLDLVIFFIILVVIIVIFSVRGF